MPAASTAAGAAGRRSDWSERAARQLSVALLSMACRAAGQRVARSSAASPQVQRASCRGQKSKAARRSAGLHSFAPVGHLAFGAPHFSQGGWVRRWHDCCLLFSEELLIELYVDVGRRKVRAAAPQASHPRAADEQYKRDLPVRPASPSEFCVFGPFLLHFQKQPSQVFLFSKIPNYPTVASEAFAEFEGNPGRLVRWRPSSSADW